MSLRLIDQVLNIQYCPCNHSKLSGIIKHLLIISGLMFSSALCASNPPPNFLVIVADDLGYSDLGAFGGEISTPNLDALAKSGIRLTNFHTSAACAPTRAMLLTGADNHQVGLGTMVQPTPEQERSPGYVQYLTDNTITIAEYLSNAGYDTMMVGKWHLGLKPEESPSHHGFSRSYVLLPGAASHYGVDQNKDFETYSWASSRKNRRAVYKENNQLVRYLVGAYSTEVYTHKMLEYLGESIEGGQPFFAYLAYTAPHWPLQAPDDTIKKYKGKYDQGPEALRKKRLQNLKSMNLISENVTPHPMENIRPWDELSEQERAVQSRKMEIYAAMVDHMDDGVGRIIQLLKDKKQFENTVIVFISDNGAEGQTTAALGGDPFIEADNSLANLGKPDSYAAYGPGWAQAASAPFRLYKAYSTEGGVRTPAFVTGPGIKGSRISGAFTYVSDITPTLLDIAGVSPVADKKDVTVDIRGHSWSQLLRGEAQRVYSDDEAVGGELFGGRYLYKGPWKITYVQDGYYHPTEAGPGKWELFNIRKDPGETTDLSGKYPKVLADLVADWHDYARDTGVVVLWDERKDAHKADAKFADGAGE